MSAASCRMREIKGVVTVELVYVEICWRWVHWQRGVGCLGIQSRYLTAREPPWERNGLPPILGKVCDADCSRLNPGA